MANLLARGTVFGHSGEKQNIIPLSPFPRNGQHIIPKSLLVSNQYHTAEKNLQLYLTDSKTC